MQNPLLDAGCQPDAIYMQTPSHLDHGSHIKDLGGPHFLISPVQVIMRLSPRSPSWLGLVNGSADQAKFRSCLIAKLVQLGLAGILSRSVV